MFKSYSHLILSENTKNMIRLLYFRYFQCKPLSGLKLYCNYFNKIKTIQLAGLPSIAAMLLHTMCFKKEEVESKLTRKKVNFLKVLCGDLQSTVNEIKKKISFYFSYTSFYFLHQFPYLFPSYTTAKLIYLELLIKKILIFF